MQKYLKQGKYTYKQSDILGSGSFGTVYKGINTYTGCQVALKKIQLKQLDKDQQIVKTTLLSEISVMKKFTKKMQIDPCPFLVKQQDVFRTDKDIYIVMQICRGGTLENQLDKSMKLNQKQCIQVLYCISRGLEYMSDMGIVHRDLKPENIFVSQTQVGKGQSRKMKVYKIGDFGFASQKQQFQMAMGTIPYMAPQMFKKEKYGSIVDVWALGIIAYQIRFSGFYFIGKDKWQFQKNIKQKPFILNQRQASEVSKNYYDFMQKCLKKQPKYRMSAQQLINHPLFFSIRKQLSQMQEALHKDEIVSSNQIQLGKKQSNSSASSSMNKLFSNKQRSQMQEAMHKDKVFSSNQIQLRKKQSNSSVSSSMNKLFINKQSSQSSSNKSKPQQPLEGQNQQNDLNEVFNQKTQILPNQNLTNQRISQMSDKLVFAKLSRLLAECFSMRILAQKFHMFQQQTKNTRKTQFIQVYLLKDAYVMMNRLTYSLIYKQNRLQLGEQQFKSLLSQQHIQQFQNIYAACTKQILYITGLFNQKYKQFNKYIESKFEEQQVNMIREIVNQEPYMQIKEEVFQKQLRKWAVLMQNDREQTRNMYRKWENIGIQCRRMLTMKLKS